MCAGGSFAVNAELTSVLFSSTSDIDSLNLAHLDYICSRKLFSGLYQRQTKVENVDNWKKTTRYCNEAERVKITTILCSLSLDSTN